MFPYPQPILKSTQTMFLEYGGQFDLVTVFWAWPLTASGGVSARASISGTKFQYKVATCNPQPMIPPP